MNGLFEFDLAALPQPKSIRIEQHLGGVRISVSVASRQDVYDWASALKEVPTVGEPTQMGGNTYWYRHTAVQVDRPGLSIRVGACDLAATISALPGMPAAVAS